MSAGFFWPPHSSNFVPLGRLVTFKNDVPFWSTKTLWDEYDDQTVSVSWGSAKSFVILSDPFLLNSSKYRSIQVLCDYGIVWVEFTEIENVILQEWEENVHPLARFIKDASGD